MGVLESLQLKQTMSIDRSCMLKYLYTVIDVANSILSMIYMSTVRFVKMVITISAILAIGKERDACTGLVSEIKLGIDSSEAHPNKIHLMLS